LGYKSSRILGLEEAFIPELRKIEPIPGMSEENREKLHRRRLAMEEERMLRLRDHKIDEASRTYQKGVRVGQWVTCRKSIPVTQVQLPLRVPHRTKKGL